ncbi:hypothetical protein [Pseudomonas rhodesiae]|uniref:hypothetical protein n=1 Tax=Pseudomonas rhodesiae TaxID=76760 RepID=UPI003D31D096
MPDLCRAYRKAGFNPLRMLIVSLSTNEVDVIQMSNVKGVGACVGVAVVLHFGDTGQSGVCGALPGSVRRREPMTACAEAVYFQVRLFAEAARRAEGTSIRFAKACLAPSSKRRRAACKSIRTRSTLGCDHASHAWTTSAGSGWLCKARSR